MSDPKKPEDAIPPGEQTYPTPPLDPATGAPIDSRFPPKVEEKEETAPKQSPKSEKAEKDEEEAETKGSEKPKRRR